MAMQLDKVVPFGRSLDEYIKMFYVFSGDEIRDRFYTVLDDIIQQVANTQADYVWTYHSSPAALKASRQATTERFYADYETGKQQGRYCLGELPNLKEADQSVDQSYELGLCSHFLFLYSLQCDQAFHIAAVNEMLRICKEVRIFPLLTLNLERSPHLEAVVSHVEQSGYRCTIEKVGYEFQRGGNEMLRIWSS
jgi:hypothetical protein